MIEDRTKAALKDLKAIKPYKISESPQVVSYDVLTARLKKPRVSRQKS